MENFDDLDRAIFALPIAEPPPGLHAAILSATIYRGNDSVAFGSRDIAAIGAVLAVMVWLAAYAISSASLESHVIFAIASFVRSLVETQTLAWLAAGAAVALVANNLQLRSFPRSGRRDRA